MFSAKPQTEKGVPGKSSPPPSCLQDLALVTAEATQLTPSHPPDQTYTGGFSEVPDLLGG